MLIGIAWQIISKVAKNAGFIRSDSYGVQFFASPSRQARLLGEARIRRFVFSQKAGISMQEPDTLLFKPRR